MKRIYILLYIFILYTFQSMADGDIEINSAVLYDLPEPIKLIPPKGECCLYGPLSKVFVIKFLLNKTNYQFIQPIEENNLEKSFIDSKGPIYLFNLEEKNKKNYWRFDNDKPDFNISSVRSTISALIYEGKTKLLKNHTITKERLFTLLGEHKNKFR